MKSGLKKLQVVISGYTGQGVSLYCAYDPETTILSVAKMGNYTEKRFRDSLLITNVSEIDSYDSLFTEKDLKAAINAFQMLFHGVSKDGKSSRLTFSSACNAANPDSAIDQDKLDPSGQKFVIRGDISNAQVATLAACWYAFGVRNVDAVLDFGDRMISLLNGGMVTF